MSNLSSALLGGAAGAAALTAVHQTARQLTKDAPRMDVLGMRAIEQTMRAVDMTPPKGDALYYTTMAGDLVSNSLYYSLVGAGKRGDEWKWGAALGLGAGIGAVVLPPLLGLGSAPSRRTTATAVMTVAWYAIGGLVAAGTARLLRQ
jgi:hypothetical protein